MRCTACGRPIFKTPAATIASRNGPLAFGPKCARSAGLTARRAMARVKAATSPRKGSSNAGQFDLFVEVSQ